MVALPSAPVAPVPVAAPLRVTVAPLTTSVELAFLTVKFTLVGVPAVTDVGLAVTVNTGVAAFAVTVTVPGEEPVLVAVAVIGPAPEAVTLMVALPSATVVLLPVANPPLNVTNAPLTAEVAFLTVKITLVGVPAVTEVGLALTVNTGRGAEPPIAYTLLPNGAAKERLDTPK